MIHYKVIVVQLKHVFVDADLIFFHCKIFVKLKFIVASYLLCHMAWISWVSVSAGQRPRPLIQELGKTELVNLEKEADKPSEARADCIRIRLRWLG